MGNRKQYAKILGFVQKILPDLSERKACSVTENQPHEHSALHRGELVLMQEKITPRGSRQLARITESRDREAIVKTRNGTLIKRPLNLLMHLEVQPSTEIASASETVFNGENAE